MPVQLSELVSQTAHGLALGDIVRFNGTDYVKSQADTFAHAIVSGVVGQVIDANNFVIQYSGSIAGLSGLTPGDRHYLSSAVAGATTTTAPTISVPVWIATTSTTATFISFSVESTFGDEQAQDAVGTILTDTATIDFTYTDATPSITADVIDNSITLAKMATIATDSFLGRDTAGTGNVEVLSVSTTKTLLDLSGTNSGDQTITLTGDVTGSGTGSFAATIDTNKVTDAKFRQSSGLSVVGNSTNATANVADITAGTDKQVLRRSGTGIGFGAVDLTSTDAVTGSLPITSGGTGQTAQTAAFDALSPLTTKGDLVVNNGTNDIRLGVGTDTYILTADSATASGIKWAANTGGSYTDEEAQDAVGTILTDTATIDFTYTDATPSITADVIDNSITLAKMATIATDSFLGRDTAGTGNVEVLSVSTVKTLLDLTGTNSGDQTITLTGDVTGSGTGSFAATIDTNKVTDAKFRQSAGLSVVGNSTNATANVADITAGTDKQVLRRSGTGIGFGAVDLTSTDAVSGALVANSFPALTGDVTTSAGNLTTAIGSNKVTLGMQATLAANTAIANATGSTATPTAVPMVSTATASAIAIRDANANVYVNNAVQGYTTTATAAGTTTLTVGSTAQQFFTGISAQTVVLPVTSTLTLGHQYLIRNNSNTAITVNSSGGNAVVVMQASSEALLTCVLTSGTSAASWDYAYTPPFVSTNTANTAVIRDASGDFSAGIITATLAGTASVANSVAVTDAASDTTTWVLVGTSQNGNMVPATDGSFVYNASTNALTATTFVGALTGNADTVTTNANLTGDVTSVGNATTIGSNKVTLGMQATLAANTAIANATGSTATPTAVPMVSAATASAIAIRDSNANVYVNNLIDGYLLTGTITTLMTLTVSSPRFHHLTGSTTFTVNLPVASTLTFGHQFFIKNGSSAVTTILSSGGNTVATLPASSQILLTCVDVLTTAVSWLVSYTPFFTNANTASAGVVRDSSGNFTAGTITANLTGTASLATTATTASTVTTNANMTGDVTSSGSNATTIASNVVSDAKIRQSAALSVVGNSTNATANVADITAATDNQVLRRSGTDIGFGAINLTSTDAVTGYLSLGNGGTGQVTLENAGLFPETITILPSTVTNSTINVASVTGMSFSIAASSTYLFRGTLTCRSAATTTGIGFGLALPASCTYSLGFYSSIATTGQSVTNNAADITTTGAPTANTNYPVYMHGILKTGAGGGTCQFLFKSEVATSTVSVMQDVSCIVSQKIL